MNSIVLRLSLSTLFLSITACLQSSKNSPSLMTSYTGLGAESLSADELKEFSPPALEPEISKQLERMLDIREMGRGIPSNDGKSLYFTWMVTGRAQVWRGNLSERVPKQLTGGEDATYLMGLSPNDQILVVARDEKGQENLGLYYLSTQGGQLVRIIHKPKVQSHFLGFSQDSQFVYFSANDRRPEDQTIYRFHFGSKKTELVFDEKGTWFISDFRDPDRLLLGKATGALSREFFEYDLNSKTLVPVLGQGKTEDIAVSFGAKPGDYFVLTNMLGNFKRLYSFVSGSFNPISGEISFDVETFDVDRTRTKLAYTTNEDGWSKLHLIDVKSMRSLDLPKVDADHWGLGNFSDNGRFLTLSLERDGQPASTYVYDFDKKELSEWLTPQVPEIDTEGFSQATLEHYSATDGTKIPMLVRKPVVCKEPCPVIIHFHGGPEAQSRPGFSAFAQIFVDAGFVFAEPNVRGSSGYGKEWISADDGAKRLNVISDIEAAALHFKQNYKKSGKSPKVGVMGYSYGGYSTLMAMTKFSESFDAGVALVGMSNLVTFLQNTAPYRRHLRISEYGDPEKDKEVLMELSPITHISKLKNPLLIIQGVSDPRVPVGEAVQMYRALKAREADASLILMSDEGHGSRSRQNQVIEIGHTLAFFKKHLL